MLLLRSSSSSSSRSTRLRTCVSGFTLPLCCGALLHGLFSSFCLIRLLTTSFSIVFHCCFPCTFVSLMHHHGDLPPVDAITYCYNSHQHPPSDFAGHTDPRESMVKNILPKSRVRRTSGRVGAKVVEEKGKSIVAAAQSEVPGANQEKVRTAAQGKNHLKDQANASQDKEESGDESDKGIDDQKDGSADDNVDLSIEYSLKLLKVGAEVYIRDTPNSSIRCKELIGKKGTIRKVDGAVGKASTWYLVDIPGAKDNAGEKKAWWFWRPFTISVQLPGTRVPRRLPKELHAG